MMVLEQKRILRDKMRGLKKQLSAEDKSFQSELVFKYIEKTPAFKDSQIILCYWSLPDELPTHEFIKKWSAYKTILLPVMVGDDLVVKKFSYESDLVIENSFGVCEPTGELFIELELIDIIIVPGVAFDKHNQRLGRGKGFYDKLLKNTLAKKIGVGFKFQMQDKLPVEKHDIMMDEVVCGS